MDDSTPSDSDWIVGDLEAAHSDEHFPGGDA